VPRIRASNAADTGSLLNTGRSAAATVKQTARAQAKHVLVFRIAGWNHADSRAFLNQRGNLPVRFRCHRQADYQSAAG
jgi:hypothetical protein